MLAQLMVRIINDFCRVEFLLYRVEMLALLMVMGIMILCGFEFLLYRVDMLAVLMVKDGNNCLWC
jgi:hypothetical protein